VIIATAGHVDHGKTSLVKALTGIDADRLPEEKRRGMTIDLGFAYRGSLGFIDVPGHERFVHNMLCGVAGIDFALLVVAVDDGVMPQTREHSAILDLLGVERGAVVLTKIDRAPPERVAAVAAEIRELLANTPLAQAPLFEVSSTTGNGIERLRSHLEAERHVAASRRSGKNFRLSIDRSFTVAGAGLVVTGTAMSGEVRVGAEVEVQLAGMKARVRGIHAHNAPAEIGRAGQRLALNLAGVDDKSRVARGDWIVAGALPPPVRKLDARVRILEGAALPHWSRVHVHLGAADVMARVALLDDTGLAQLAFEAPVASVRGERFILRDAAARRTLAGGAVLDVYPPLRGRARPQRLAWLKAMEIDDDAKALAAVAELSPKGVDLEQFAANRNLALARGWHFADPHWRALREAALGNLAAWHARSPDSPGAPQARALERTGVHASVGTRLLEELAAEGRVVREAGVVRLSGHAAALNPADAGLWKKIVASLEGTRPPSVAELAAAQGMEAAKVEAALSRIARQGLLLRISKTRFFRPEPLGALKALAGELCRGPGGLTAAVFRDRSGVGRNLSIELLEYFDRIKWTRRVGDARVLMRTSELDSGRDSHPGGAHGLQIR
jgi:selenocysteine-specific elongation factor